MPDRAAPGAPGAPGATSRPPRPAALPVIGVPERMTRRLGAIVLVAQSVVLVFAALTAWGLLGAADHAGATPALVAGLGLAALGLLASGLLRTPIGLTLGWVVQVGSLLAAFVLPVMLVVGLIFLALWVTALVQGRKMDALTAEFLLRSSAS